MNKELKIPYYELQTLAENLGNTFIQRHDLYAKQLDDGRYLCIHKPLESRHIIAHLLGKITLGTYLLDPRSHARFIVFDADADDQMYDLFQMSQNLNHNGVASYLEASRRGCHLWLFFSQPVPGKEARKFGKGLIMAYNLADIELFPKQDRLKTGPGSLIRLPFGIHRKDGQRYGFMAINDEPLAPATTGQIRMLATPQCIPNSFLDSYRTSINKQRKNKATERSGEFEKTLAERIKRTVSVYEFVSKYVELSPTGQGFCPFHEDHHSSFSVNMDENYWHCFAGCGGGSVIDFWMKWQGCDFTTGVKELAKILLM